MLPVFFLCWKLKTLAPEKEKKTMIEIKETENINIGPEDQPGGAEPHKELIVWNKENIDQYLQDCPTDEKNNKVVPDDFFNDYYKILPVKVVNASGTWRTTPTGGKIKIFGGDPEEDKAIQEAGGKSLQAAIKQRRTIAEDIKTMLAQVANSDICEQLGLNAGADNQTALVAAMLLEATSGNVKAGQFLRDTIGEQPTSKQEITADIMTDHDRDLIEKLQKKLENK